MSAKRPLAIVTGARRGIGAAIATGLARRGFDLAIVDLPGDDASDTRTAIAGQGGRAAFFALDLAEIAAHGGVLQSIEAWGGEIACLVDNAGLPAAVRGDLLDLQADAFDRVLDVNLRGTFFFTQAVAKRMVAANRGASARSIIVVSSVSAESASIERGEYCLSKAALPMLVRLFALRLAPHGIGVFEVRPGIIKTPMTAPVAGKYDQRIADGLVPAGRWGEPDDIGRIVAALAGGDFGFATGSVIDAGGGLTIPRL